MSNSAIRAALTAHLFAMSDCIPIEQTEFENDEEFKATDGVPYQQVSLNPATPFDYSGLPGSRRYQGIFQVSLCFPADAGPGEAEDYADRLEAWFAKGLQVTANGVNTRLGQTPEIRQGRREGDRWVKPVRIFYFANV